MTTPRPADPHVDPELARQLSESTPEGTLSAVFTLRTPAGLPFLGAAETQELVQKILHSQAALAKQSFERLKVFANTQSFALEGPPELIRKILHHPSVASAIADRQSQSMLIAPVSNDVADVAPPKQKSPKKSNS